MSETIPSELIRLFRDRRALLWVCQRYDLLPGEEPHDYKLPPSEASLRYRPEPESTDFKLAARYWEAVWVEGARSPLLEVFRATAEKQLPGASRAIVVLASDTDSRALVSSQEFLTICVLPGLIDKEAVPEAQYGKVRARARERAAWNLSARLTLYQQRLLVVIGAREGDDLNDLYEVLEDNPIADLNLLVIWPKDEPFPSAPENPAVSLYFWTDSIEQLCDVLEGYGAPAAKDLPEWSIRVGTKTLELPARSVHRILNRFALVTEHDLLPPDEFYMEDLHDFLRGSLDNWKAFWAGLPVPRSYTSEEGLLLTEEVKNIIRLLENEDSPVMTHTLQVPCEGGSGATTLIRSAAIDAASKGYPTIFLRPEQVEIDLEEVVQLLS